MQLIETLDHCFVCRRDMIGKIDLGDSALLKEEAFHTNLRTEKIHHRYTNHKADSGQ
jgi:hypothetical protein